MRRIRKIWQKILTGTIISTIILIGCGMSVLAETKITETASAVTAKTGSTTLNYPRYSQQKGSKGYLKGPACVTTAVAIIAKAYGVDVTPAGIHSGSVKDKNSERYAVAKMKKADRNTKMRERSAISTRTAYQILRDMGIPASVVYKYKDADAIRQIRAHLKKGRPVLVKCNNRTYKGVRIADAHHAVVLIGLDNKDRPIFIDSMTGKLNYAHSSKKTLNVSLSAFVKKYMLKASGPYKKAYVTSINSGGGYILVG